ncbi:FecR family protein [Mucilaginibacter sp. FT3.2]|uniref:FecR family protein n=1 Tax=Mucilaginibacter sp. FT3.2 TaxID=2723090 RepID=UPI0016168707|nr:FecR domain-containing protein [Mucilaginibacter sp. FT3.2]MBB6230368.1 ferric-dicitrate binding protein FerR (iron transport regulator) [Mucilaginibacter sp. FT3.2]
MGKSRFIELMAKSMDGSASKEELDELELFLNQYPGYKKIHNVTDALTGTLKKEDAVLPDSTINNNLDELWVKIKSSEVIESNPLNDNVRQLNYWKWAGVAAAVAAVTLLGFLFYSRQANQQFNAAVIKKIDVPFGKMMQVTLSDGTKVKLNAGSHFTYPSVFAGNQREVNLEGEGFFEVTKNPKRPFLVHTTGFTVKVLGTIFNVKAYRDDKSTETTLLKGKVQVELADDPDKKIILSPHEKLTINSPSVVTDQPAKTAIAKIKYEVATLPNISTDTYPENAWIDNKIVFANSEFEDVARQMERKYDVQIVFKDDALKKEQISGVLENESLDTALNFLRQIVPLQSKVEGSTVYLSYKTKK